MQKDKKLFDIGKQFTFPAAKEHLAGKAAAARWTTQLQGRVDEMADDVESELL